MTKAEETLDKRIIMFPEDLESGMTDEAIRRNVVASMFIHAQEFAEWCSCNGWNKSDLWENQTGLIKTTSELYTIFNNQNK